MVPGALALTLAGAACSTSTGSPTARRCRRRRHCCIERSRIVGAVDPTHLRRTSQPPEQGKWGQGRGASSCGRLQNHLAMAQRNSAPTGGPTLTAQAASILGCTGRGAPRPSEALRRVSGNRPGTPPPIGCRAAVMPGRPATWPSPSSGCDRGYGHPRVGRWCRGHYPDLS